jgi:hypothetical protein
MPNKNQASSPADFFSGGGDLFKNLAEEEKRKKLAAANAAPQLPGTEKPGLPTARPSAPLSPVRDVAAGGAGPKLVQTSVDFLPPVNAQPLTDVTGKVQDIVRRKMTSDEDKSYTPTKKSDKELSPEDKKRLMDNLSESLKKLKLPSEPSSKAGVLDKAANFISEVYEDQWAKPSREYEKAMKEIQAARDRNAKKTK